MPILCDVEVLEDWLEMNTFVLNSSSVLFQEIFNSLHLCWVICKILPPRKQSIVLGDSGNSGLWGFVNTCSCESFIDVSYKCGILEESFWVIGLVLGSQKFKFIISQSEVHARKDRLKLSTSNSAFSQFIEVMEELLNSDSFHDNGSPDSVLNVFWIIGNINALLLESIVDHIKLICGLFEVCAHLCWCDSETDCFLCFTSLCHVGREHVFWTIHVLDEKEVIDLIVVSAVTILSNDQIEDLRIRRHQVECLQHTQELSLGDMKLLGLVEILEAILKEDSVRNHLLVKPHHRFKHLTFFLIREQLFKFMLKYQLL